MVFWLAITPSSRRQPAHGYDAVLSGDSQAFAKNHRPIQERGVTIELRVQARKEMHIGVIKGSIIIGCDEDLTSR